MIRLAIADDHQSLLDGIRLHIKEDPLIKLSATLTDGQALVDLVRRKPPDVIITDIRMPKMDGITATQMIKSEYPNIKILALTMFDQDDAVKQMLDAGADGYILKNASLDEVIQAIKTLYEGKKYYDPQLIIKDQAEDVHVDHPLTRRQEEILRLIGQGKTSREIADELFIGVYTVNTHRKNIMQSLGLAGRGELMRYALDRKYDFER